MEDFLRQVDEAVAARLYYVSLFASLVLPDICAALESKDAKATGSRYIDWFDRHLGPKYQPVFSGADAYHFRCSLLHRGSSQHPKSSYARVLFIEPGATTNVFHLNVMNDALNIDVNVFCGDVVEAVRAWHRNVEGTEPFEANFKQHMRRHPDGLAPYIGGVPVIS